MFTIYQIKEAHSKVKSGADFPLYVQDLIKLGVKKYEAYVNNGHIIYFGKNDFKTISEAKYPAIEVKSKSDKSQFQHNLKEHQDGKTDYHTFCLDCAKSGIEKWVVDTEKMTCIYYDKAGNEMLAELIPNLK